MFNHLEALCSIIDKLTKQESARGTIHALLYTLRKQGASAAFVAVKDRTTDTLRIVNQVELSETVRRSFTRGVGTGVIGRVFMETDALIVTKATDPEGYKELLLAGPYGAAFVARIADEGRAFGVLVVYFAGADALDSAACGCLQAAANLCTLALERERNSQLLGDLRQVNPDTGLLYYHYFHKRLHDEFAKATRYRQELALAVIDIDNYKEAMRRRGAPCGIALCSAVIAELRACTRGIDVIAHFGIDEFIIYLPHTDRKGADIVLKRFQQRLKNKEFTDKKIATSASIGLTTRQDGVSFEQFLQDCQIALAEAKRAGNGALRHHASA